MIDFTKDYYIQEDKMYVAADCIIFGFDDGNLKLLIFKRRFKPLLGEWSLIGSFVKLEDFRSVAEGEIFNIYFYCSKNNGDIYIY